MGYGRYDDKEYSLYSASAAERGVNFFEHNERIEKGQVARATHELLLPSGVIRESRDSDNHPTSVACAMIFDVTGSMKGSPRIFQESLPNLFNMLLQRNYIPDPQLLVGCVGDATSRDVSPLQVGQFESDAKVAEHLSRMHLEGQGGAFGCESYELAGYFMARRTSIDCMEKRGKRGYLFMAGDELPYDTVSPQQVREILGENIQWTELSTDDLFTELKQKYDTYFIVPGGTSGAGSTTMLARWGRLVGEDHVLQLPDPRLVCELIAATIGYAEGNHSLTELGDHIRGQGGRDSEAETILNVLRATFGERTPERNIIRS